MNMRLIFIFCLFFLFSCNQRWQKAFDKFDESMLFHNGRTGWKLAQEIKSEWDTNYTIEKKDGDTLKTLIFLERRKDGSIAINEYKKRWPCNIAETCYLEISSGDTLFFYIEKNNDKKFIVGEYAYRFANFKMDSIEVDFYLKHEDSLKRVRGNGLPRLHGEKKGR